MQLIKENIKFFYSSVLHAVLPFFFKNMFNHIGIKDLKARVKKSERVYILATGSSINNYTDEDFSEIGLHDSIGINFFTIHDFIPSLYSIEVHSDKFCFFQSVKKDCNVPLLYRGYSSLPRIFEVVSNLRNASINNCSIFLAQEANAYNFIDDCVKSDSDYIYNYSISLLTWVGVAIRMGYSEIVLCGVDMDSDYFFCQDGAPEKYLMEAKKRRLCNVEHVHKAATDPLRKQMVYSALSSLLAHYGNSKELCPVKVHSKSCALGNFFEKL